MTDLCIFVSGAEQVRTVQDAADLIARQIDSL